ncbi:hypothetical protein BDN67DRAFT_983500 [Paxillus ammoniavirescens]|nr:hypothetical protein BDN67DRAFT_983500 [Paxillus ammoniavirescens]
MLIDFFSKLDDDINIHSVAEVLKTGYAFLQEDPDSPQEEGMYRSTFLLELITSTHLSNIVGFVEVPEWDVWGMASGKTARLEHAVKFIAEGPIDVEQVLADMANSPDGKMKIKLPKVLDKHTGCKTSAPFQFSSANWNGDTAAYRESIWKRGQAFVRSVFTAMQAHKGTKNGTSDTNTDTRYTYFYITFELLWAGNGMFCQLFHEDPDSLQEEGMYHSTFLLELIASTHLSNIVGFVEVPGWDVWGMASGKNSEGVIAMASAALEHAVKFIAEGPIDVEQVLADMANSPDGKMKIKLPKVLNKHTGCKTSAPFQFSSANWNSDTAAYQESIRKRGQAFVHSVCTAAQAHKGTKNGTSDTNTDTRYTYFYITFELLRAGNGMFCQSFHVFILSFPHGSLMQDDVIDNPYTVTICGHI